MIYALFSIILSAVGAASALAFANTANEPLGLVVGFAATIVAFATMIVSGFRS